MSIVAVYSYTQSITYVADNILKSLKDIIRLSGLDPSNFIESWTSTMLALRIWLQSGHLERVTLEIFDPKTEKLVVRWDLEIIYGWTSGDGSFWTDTEQLRYHILKAGVAASQARYGVLMSNKPGRPDVEGWGSREVSLNRWHD